MKLKAWMIEDIANSAYKHGEAYRLGNIYRNVGRYAFKHPSHCLPDWVMVLDIETHAKLERLYKRSFRAGLNNRDMIVSNFYN